MSEHSLVRRALLSGAALSFLLGGVTADAPPEPSVYSLNVDPSQQGITIYPVEVVADGLGAPKETPQQLKAEAQEGWRIATGMRTNNVVVEPLKVVSLPGITSLPDLCDKDAARGFRRELLRAVLPKYRGAGIPMIAIEQTVKSDCTIMGNAGTDNVIVETRSEAFTEFGAAHEFGHLLGLAHAQSINCDGENTAVKEEECRVVPYGNPFTVQGSQSNYDASPFNGPELIQLGRLAQGQIITVDRGSQQVAITALNAYEHSQQPQLIRVPLRGAARGTGMAGLSDATAVTVELSDEISPGGNAYPSLKLTAINERDNLHGNDSYLLQPGRIHLIDSYTLGRQHCLRLGTVSMCATLDTLDTASATRSQSSAEVTVKVLRDRGGEDYLG